MMKEWIALVKWNKYSDVKLTKNERSCAQYMAIYTMLAAAISVK